MSMKVRKIVNRLFGKKDNGHAHKVNDVVIVYEWDKQVRHIYTVNHDGRVIHKSEMLDRFGNWG